MSKTFRNTRSLDHNSLQGCRARIQRLDDRAARQEMTA